MSLKSLGVLVTCSVVSDDYDNPIAQTSSKALPVQVGSGLLDSSTSFFDPIDLQLRAMYIPRFGKRSPATLTDMWKKSTFQPRIGRSNFQPRVGRADLLDSSFQPESLRDMFEEEPSVSKEVSYGHRVPSRDSILSSYFNPIRPVRASFQPRIGRSASTPAMDNYKENMKEKDA